MREVGERVLLQSGTKLQGGIILDVVPRYRVQTSEGKIVEVGEEAIIGTPPATPLTADEIKAIGREAGVSLLLYQEESTIYLKYEGGFSSYFCKLAKAQLLTREQFTQMLEKRIRRDAWIDTVKC